MRPVRQAISTRFSWAPPVGSLFSPACERYWQAYGNWAGFINPCFRPGAVYGVYKEGLGLRKAGSKMGPEQSPQGGIPKCAFVPLCCASSHRSFSPRRKDTDVAVHDGIGGPHAISTVRSRQGAKQAPLWAARTILNQASVSTRPGRVRILLHLGSQMLLEPSVGNPWGKKLRCSQFPL